MEPPKGVFGNVLVGSLALGGAAWAGAALNRRSVASPTAAGRVAAAALGGTTAALLALFGAAALSVGDSKWKTLGQTTTVLGIGGLAALSMIGLRVNDKILSAAAGGAQALTAGESDSGKSFSLKVGDTLTVELPAGQAGFAWSWSNGPAGSLTGPAQALSSSGLEQDTWTAAGPGDGKLTAQLAPTAGGASIATWTADVSVTS